jgi:hypothetical protein
VAELISYQLDSGVVRVEVDDDEFARVSRAGTLDTTTRVLTSALGQVRDAADVALRQFREMISKPDEVQIEFGVKLTAQAGAVIAKSGLEGQLKVKLTWRRDTADEDEEVDQSAPDPAPRDS